MAGTRRRARTVALQALFEVDCAGHDHQVTISRLLTENPMAATSAAFVADLVRGVIDHKEEIDSIIQQAAPLWPLKQISPIDRNILRLAILEILFDNKVPVKAAINEAVELAKTFGSESSPKFVNGVLGTISAKAHR